MRTNNGGEVFKGEFGKVCIEHPIKQESTTVNSPEFNGVAERALGIIESSVSKPGCCIRRTFIALGLYGLKRTSGNAARMNRTATTANDKSKTPYDLWYRRIPPSRVFPLLRPCYCRVHGQSKALLKSEGGRYLETPIDHPQDSTRILSRGGGELQLHVASPRTHRHSGEGRVKPRPLFPSRCAGGGGQSPVSHNYTTVSRGWNICLILDYQG